MYQRLMLCGNLGKDPELRYTQDGRPVTRFSMATNRPITNQNGDKENLATWWQVQVYNAQAEACNQYLKKGSKVFVEGILLSDPATGSPRIWTGNNGQPMASFAVRAYTVQFLSSQGSGVAPDSIFDDGDGGGSGGYKVDEDEIPF